MKPSEVLRKARALIEKPENWTQGEYARTAQGSSVSGSNEYACSWCSMGAIQACSPELATRQKCYDLLRALAGVEYVGDFNDTHTHAEVLDLFDRAIAAAEARGE